MIAHGKPLAFDTIGCNVASFQGTRKTNLTYQIHFADSWVVGNVYLVQKDGSNYVLASHFQPVAGDLEELNRFSIHGKSPIHYAVLVACIAIPAFILYTLVVCIRSQIRRKWLWIIFILFGVFQFRLDWVTGRYDVQPLSILLFGASAFRASSYAAWVLSCAVPLGAIIFLAHRRKLTLPDVTHEA